MGQRERYIGEEDNFEEAIEEVLRLWRENDTLRARVEELEDELARLRGVMRSVLVGLEGDGCESQDWYEDTVDSLRRELEHK
jgi:predicted nuclease with TOPRIM domain